MQKSNRKGHLTLIERDKITILKSEGLSIRFDISHRPLEANLRLEFGHFEADTIESKKRRVKL